MKKYEVNCEPFPAFFVWTVSLKVIAFTPDTRSGRELLAPNQCHRISLHFGPCLHEQSFFYAAAQDLLLAS
jgi:hypothetical protein